MIFQKKLSFETEGVYELTSGTQVILMIIHIGSQYLIIIYGNPYLTIGEH